MDFSIINYYGKQISKCGYCKQKDCSIAHGMHAYNLCPQDYQDLIDRGWRRSGHYCYKPDNKTTCCPCYTIKCNALDFKLTKSHKKVLKRMTRFLRDGKKDKIEEDRIATEKTQNDIDGADGGDGGGGGIRDEPKQPDIPIPNVNLEAVAAANPEQHAAAVHYNEHFDDKQFVDKSNVMQVEQATSSLGSSTSLEGSKKSLECINPPCKKAKQMRLERRQAKLAAKGVIENTTPTTTTTTTKTNTIKEKTLADYIADAGPDDKHKLKIILIPSNKQKVTDEAFNLYRKYQLFIHNDDPARLSPTSLQRFCYKSPLKLQLVHVKSKQFKDTQSQTYELYEKYQTKIHKDPPEDVTEYLEFLQRSPLKLTKTHDGPTAGYGSFHHQYWLDDKLIAVGVIDILPYCVSSVYFFYDPDYSFLSLGTYGSLREIDYVHQLAAKIPALKYYYMGFYIHSCPKMRYKGKLVPSYLLCPETYTWHLLTDETRSKLDKQKYLRLNADLTAKDIDDFDEEHLGMVLLLIENNTYITYREYIQSFNIVTLDNMLDAIRSRIYKEITGDDDDRESILEYGKLVGKTCAHRMLYLKI